MKKTRGSLSLLLAGLLVAACSSIGPGTTIPPIPPINIPSFSIPTFPPIVLPPGVSIPPIVFPSADPSGGLCRLVSTAEMAAAIGGGATITVTETTDTTCTYLASPMTIISVRTESGDLSTAGILLSEPKSITVAGNPALIGSFMGILLYINKGGQNLVVQAALMENSEANQQKIIAIGTTAASRW